jgi:MFS family permease
MGNQFLVMFAIGYLQPTLELHLLSFGIKEKNIGYWFVLNTSCYFASCIFISRITNYISKTKLMIIGNIFMFLFFTLTGPSPIYFSPSLSFVTLSLVFLGLSGGFLYGKFYLVPSLPHMIDVAYLDYDYKEDYRLTDSLSGITNISLCAGEIIGPIVSSFLYYEFGYAKASTIVSFFVLAHGINYAYHSDAFRKIKSKDLLSSELIEYRSTK